ncbi:hypothetical protein BkAM31D_20145 [Halalkalibacter krulwichiae]|uniref:Probable membrane transporter protein n=1 Tax=Halalkalibacter krulwichiae TaxID=199441 RepID=A0A1X9MEU8_9BACI|nr:sulfite exporter TauE/SafE family protein [Halalkalibacter krulwichiae]ARK31967.1 hypothetical protein BkAM31D_20145 [Halalkalibacter krulwichiae]
MIWVLLVLVGLVGSTLGSLMGLGGGIVVVPALLLLGSFSLLEITPQLAVGISLIVMIVTGLSATLAYIKQKKIDFKSAWLFFCASGPGAIVGAWINKGFDTESFQLYLGVFIIFISLILFIRHRLKPRPYRKKRIERTVMNEDGTFHTYGYNVVPVLILSFLVGMLSGLFGIGGGSLMVPAMIILFHFPPHRAVATSMFMILLSAIVGSISHISMGNVNWFYVLALLPGAWIGGILGAEINRRLSSEKLVFVLRFVLLIIAFRLIYEGLS